MQHVTVWNMRLNTNNFDDLAIINFIPSKLWYIFLTMNIKRKVFKQKNKLILLWLASTDDETMTISTFIENSSSMTT